MSCHFRSLLVSCFCSYVWIDYSEFDPFLIKYCNWILPFPVCSMTACCIGRNTQKHYARVQQTPTLNTNTLKNAGLFKPNFGSNVDKPIGLFFYYYNFNPTFRFVHIWHKVETTQHFLEWLDFISVCFFYPVFPDSTWNSGLAHGSSELQEDNGKNICPHGRELQLMTYIWLFTYLFPFYIGLVINICILLTYHSMNELTESRSAYDSLTKVPR